MAFDVEKWIDKKATEPYEHFKVAGEVVLIRPLNGVEWETVLLGEANGGSRYIGWLECGLLKPETKEPYGVDIINQLFSQCTATSIKIANRIKEITGTVLNEQFERMEQAEKNLEGTGTNPPAEDGADTTASPRSQQKNRVSENS